MAGSCVLSNTRNGINLRWLEYICTADASDGTIAPKVIPGFVDYFIYSAEAWPGATAPTDGSGYTITDEEGEDFLGGNGATAIDDVNKTTIVPKSTKANATFQHHVKGDLTLTITQAAVATNSAIINIRITCLKHPVYW